VTIRPNLPDAWFELACAHELAGHDDDAQAAYSKAGDLAPREGGPVENHLHFVQRLASWFERQDPATWSNPAPAGGKPSPVSRHVFLLGYPRSGTTLTEADLAFLRDDESLDKLIRLDPALAEQMRAAYWARVRAEVPDFEGKTFVDMAPLNGIKLPMIARLFPQALVVLCRRDPRDVVLSCFRRNFTVNASTYQFTSLDSTARHYDAVMRLMEKHLQVLPLPVHVVDYASLIAGFDATTRALTEFVGVPWSGEMRDFSRTAAERDIRTASAPQVRQGLFDGTRQWLAYREQMESVLPALERWVVKFGYEL